jgi:hypothetical protein
MSKKTNPEDLIQLGALAVLGYLAYQKLWGGSPSPAVVSTVQPGLQPSSQNVVSTPLDPDFGVTSPSSGWDDTDTSLLAQAASWGL